MGLTLHLVFRRTVAKCDMMYEVSFPHNNRQASNWGWPDGDWMARSPGGGCGRWWAEVGGVEVYHLLGVSVWMNPHSFNIMDTHGHVHAHTHMPTPTFIFLASSTDICATTLHTHTCIHSTTVFYRPTCKHTRRQTHTHIHHPGILYWLIQANRHTNTHTLNYHPL